MPKRKTISVKLPANFLAKMGFMSRQRFVVVFWEGEINATVCYDGVKYQRAKGSCVFVGLCCREDVAALLEKHHVRVGWAATTVLTHWLVIDQQADEAFFMPVDQAYRRVSPQKPILEPTQQRLPFDEE
ncbi:MAG: hypothetical protein ABSF26_30870 [Thermoguttaceae bacterium]|jgi:hypothetical protein